MISLVHISEKCWSIADLQFDDGQPLFAWWCGTDHGWVQPGSSYWNLNRDCDNLCFPSRASAEYYAKDKGFL